ncbi:MAG: serine/threonine protein kinase [Deltaproteobacteria bacterium]|nr:serine/threonine protein kinase [Deltaproteobacteria bacterium]
MATGLTNAYPQQFGKYTLTAKIAMGGMAEIFRAKSFGAEGFEKVLVIKRILPHFSEDEGFVTMFKDEARVAAHLTHANVVQVFDFDTVDDLFYIAMEYVEGRDLKRVLDVGAKFGKPLSIAQAVYVMIEASKGLDYAHKRVVDGNPLNIIHRDVSPHNVMVSFAGEVKIMDFGIAKAASRSTKTRVGTVKGKCAYMSPEQARGKNLDARSDLFALGVCLWEMLTGKRLFVGETDFETLNNVLKAEVPPPSELNAEVPKELDAIVLRSLAKDVSDRQKDVGQFVNELNRWFFSAVPDPDAINLNGYMQDLFIDEIAQLRSDTANEAAMLEAHKRGGATLSGQRKPGTGSQPQARAMGGDDERTMALPDAAMAGDSDRTMAIPDAMAAMRSKSQVAIPMQGASQIIVQKQSNTGLLIGIGALLAVAIGIGAFVLLGKKDDRPAAGAVAVPAPPVERPKLKFFVKAPGASEILVDGLPACMSKDTCDIEVEAGKHKVIAKNADGKGVDQEIDVQKGGEVVELKVPEVAKKADPAPQVAAVAPNVFVKVAPDNATVTVNGQPLALVGGTGKVANVKAGDALKIEIKAEGHKNETVDRMVTKDETFEFKLEKDKGTAVATSPGEKKEAPAGPGKLTVSAKPWAKVMIKGKEYGLTPQTITLPAGKYTVTLIKGTVTKTAGATVKAGGAATVSVDMNAE